MVIGGGYMKWCNNCQTEYEDYVEVCADCQADLQERQEVVETFQVVEPVLLRSCNDNQEADLLLSQLESEGIMGMKKYQGSSSYLNIYAGVSYQGCDVYVSEEVIDRAKEISQGFSYDHQVLDEDYDGKDLKGYNFRRNVVKLGVVLFLLSGLVYGVWYFSQIFSWLFS